MMQAMVLEQQGPIEQSPLRLTELPLPEPGAGEVLVRVSVCAVCRTDLHIVEGDLPPHRLPIVPGHQVVGRVERLGSGCTQLKVGQRVGIAWLRHTDGTCIYCRRGRENLCPGSRYTGYDADGGYAEHVLAPEAFACLLPESFDDEHAAPLLCAGLIGYRALQRAAVPEDGRLVLAGFGSSAHLVLQLAVHRGHRCFVLSRSDEHRQQARALGAVWAGDDAAALPEPMDSAILFAPAGQLVPPLLASLAPGGTLAIAGIHLSDVPPLNYQRHLFHEKQVRSVTANTRADARALLREAVEADVRPQVTRYALDQANQALQDMKHSRGSGTAVLLIGD
ncbi:MAG: zinc-dependent alcohol dehydrogenase family protein [Phycisphaeraceae bacterium]